MSEAIVVKSLSKHFGNFKAVDNISFTVKRGEIFGFLGANGAGKTTAIRMLCGLLSPSSGKANVAGFDIYKQRESVKLHIGYMSQRFSLYNDLTVWENIELYGGIYRLSRKDIKARGFQALEELKLIDVRKKLVKSLPLGWKQKLSFSVAMLHQPSIVFLDEPTGGVDPVTRRQFWEMIYAASNRGVTVFITTHYMDEAEYCDRVSIMVSGRIEALDTPSSLRKLYAASNMNDVFLQLARG